MLAYTTFLNIFLSLIVVNNVKFCNSRAARGAWKSDGFNEACARENLKGSTVKKKFSEHKEHPIKRVIDTSSDGALPSRSSNAFGETATHCNMIFYISQH